MAYLRIKVDIIDNGKVEKLVELKSPSFSEIIKAGLKMLFAYFKSKKL